MRLQESPEGQETQCVGVTYVGMTTKAALCRED